MQFLKVPGGQFIRIEAIDRLRVTTFSTGASISVFVLGNQVAGSEQYSSTSAAETALAELIDSILTGVEIVEFPPA